MRRFWCAIGVVVIGLAALTAQRSIAHQSVTVTNAAAATFTLTDAALTCANVSPCPTGTAQSIRGGYVSVVGQAICFYLDGSTPAATCASDGNGHLAAVGVPIYLRTPHDVTGFTFIGVNGGNSIVTGSFDRP